MSNIEFVSKENLATFKEETDVAYIKSPSTPSTDGTYQLEATVNGSSVTYSLEPAGGGGNSLYLHRLVSSNAAGLYICFYSSSNSAQSITYKNNAYYIGDAPLADMSFGLIVTKSSFNVKFTISYGASNSYVGIKAEGDSSPIEVQTSANDYTFTDTITQIS